HQHRLVAHSPEDDVLEARRGERLAKGIHAEVGAEGGQDAPGRQRPRPTVRGRPLLLASGFLHRDTSFTRGPPARSSGSLVEPEDWGGRERRPVAALLVVAPGPSAGSNDPAPAAKKGTLPR